MSKKRILFVTENIKMASGFGTYGKEIINRLYNTGKYEIAELCCYGSPDQFNNTKWLVYCNGPMANEPEYNDLHKKNPSVQWGLLRFDKAVLDFKPDIVATYRDPWMDGWIADSVLLPFFHWVWMPTVDSQPQKAEWIYNMFNRCDGLLAYSEFGQKVLSEQTCGRVVPKGIASPAIDYNAFKMIEDKRSHKEKYGIPQDSFVIGTVMRNQKRKMFAELMQSVSEYIKESNDKNIYLYIHTSYPEKMGWDITKLMHEYNLGSRLLCTYYCQACRKFFPAIYRDGITVCKHCKNHSAIMPGVSSGIDHKDLSEIYNLMDMYVQYAICEGFGMPQVEAAACGVPLCGIDYSAMSDVLTNCNGFKIDAILEREMETDADRAKANPAGLKAGIHYYRTYDNIELKRYETARLCRERYNWDRSAKVWEEYFDKVKKKAVDWNAPPLMKSINKEAPQGLSNYQFAEYVYNNIIQDEYHVHNYKMIKMVRDLNFGATFTSGTIAKYSQETAFDEALNLAERRYFTDSLRSGPTQQNPDQFILEAHRRLSRR